MHQPRIKQPRTYTMRARAAAVEETRRRILEATFALAGELVIADIGLDAVARRAGVSVQTVLRQFGNRAGLIEATAEHGARLVAVERRPSAGDLAGAMGVLLDHYEQRGDALVMLLAQESDPVVTRLVETGREVHRGWVAEVFAPFLPPAATAGGPGEGAAAREEVLDLLAVATDVYAWKLLRRDRGLGRAAVEERMTRLATAVLDTARRPTSSEVS